MGYLWSCVVRAQLRAQTFHTSHWIAVVTEMLFEYLIVIVSLKAAEKGMSAVAKKVDTFAPPILQ